MISFQLLSGAYNACNFKQTQHLIIFNMYVMEFADK